MDEKERAIRDAAWSTGASERDKEIWQRLRISERSVREHDETIIKNWNAVVPQDGVVYHLGDVAFGRYDSSRITEILTRLNGKIYLILGNHDKKINLFADRFEWIKTYYEMTVHDQDMPNGRVHINLSHYLMLNFNKQHYKAWMLWAHSHQNMNSWVGQFLPEMRCLDVGVDGHDFTPWSFAEVKAFMAKKNGFSADHHDKTDKER